MMPYVQTHGKIIEGRPGSQIDPDLELFRVPDRDAVLSGCLTLRQRVVSSVLRFGANPPPSKILPVELPIAAWRPDLKKLGDQPCGAGVRRLCP
jgi:hypothetical protein